MARDHGVGAFGTVWHRIVDLSSEPHRVRFGGRCADPEAQARVGDRRPLVPDEISRDSDQVADDYDGTTPVPLPLRVASRRIARCAMHTAVLVAHRRLHQPHQHVGRTMTFADGSTGVVYREPVADLEDVSDPAVLVVAFTLRGIHGRLGHALFRTESLLNTPLFAGFPGFVSKLWLTADEQGRYRGFYQWDGVHTADDYVRALWWPLALVSHRQSIRYRVLPGRYRDDVVRVTESEEATRGSDTAWWRPVRTAADEYRQSDR